jgi:hypothetical protein
MTLKITPGRIQASNTLGQNVLDSDQRQLHRLDYHSGSMTFAAYARSADIGVTSSHVVGTCDPAATVVTGAIRANSASAGLIGHAPGAWAIGGGTYIHALDYISPYNLKVFEICVMQSFTFRADSGQLVLDYTLFACRDPGAYPTNMFVAIEAVTLEWRLWSGTFDN